MDECCASTPEVDCEVQHPTTLSSFLLPRPGHVCQLRVQGLEGPHLLLGLPPHDVEGLRVHHAAGCGPRMRHLGVPLAPDAAGAVHHVQVDAAVGGGQRLHDGLRLARRVWARTRLLG